MEPERLLMVSTSAPLDSTASRLTDPHLHSLVTEDSI
jgi:hypothetical protein